MSRHAVVALLGLLAACQGAPPGYLNTDVLEPAGLKLQEAKDVKFQGGLFQEGKLTYTGAGEVQATSVRYIDEMRRQDWSPSSSTGTPTTSFTTTLVKDTRKLTLEVTGEAGGVKVVISVGGSPK